MLWRWKGSADYVQWLTSHVMNASNWDKRGKPQSSYSPVESKCSKRESTGKMISLLDTRETLLNLGIYNRHSETATLCNMHVYLYLITQFKIDFMF